MTEKKFRWMYGWRMIKCKGCKKSFRFSMWNQIWLYDADFFDLINPEKKDTTPMKDKPLEGIECPSCGKEQTAPLKFYKKTHENLLRSSSC